MHSPPRLTGVLCALRDAQRIRPVLRCLQQQNFAGFELMLIVSPAVKAELDPGWWEPFPCQILDYPLGKGTGEAWQMAVEHTRSPYLVWLEDHSFPEPGWAEALHRAMSQGAAAAGPSVANGNPGTLSWADYACGHAAYAYPQANPVASTPSHNSCYRADLLTEVFGQELSRALRSERVLQHGLREKGHEIRLVPTARVRHVNISRWIPYLQHKLLGGMIFGANRSEGWGPLKRMVYVVGAPLIPLVRLARWLPTLRAWPDPQERRSLWKALRYTFLGFVVHSAGEWIGYLTGNRFSDWADATYSVMELGRWDHVTEADRQGMRERSLSCRR